MSRANIPLVQSPDRLLNQVQQNFRQALNPVLSNDLVFGRVLSSVALASGSNTVQHGLGRPLTGWFIVRIRASATVYDTQDANSTPSDTLLLTASAPATVDIYVY